MRTIFMGTPDFAVPALKALIDSPDYNVVAVYSQPPRPAGRGYKEQYSPVHLLAHQHNIEVRTPLSLKGEIEQEAFRELRPDVAVVAAYGLILPKGILQAPRLGCVNIHSSLLPRWRGAAPIQRAIMAGDTETGVTLMQMDTGLDTGPMLATAKTPITPTTTASSLHDRLAELGAHLLLPTIHELDLGELIPVPQHNEDATYAKKLSKEESAINWQEAAIVIERNIRALNPWPGTYFTFGNENIKVLAAELVEGSSDKAPGTVLDDKLTIACGSGVLRPTLIQRPGKRATTTEEVLRGFEIPVGTNLKS